MKMILVASAATLMAFSAYAVEPAAPAANNPAALPSTANPAPDAVTMPASAVPMTSCADMITRARGMSMPNDAAKATTARSEIAAADAAGDDATCRTHAQNALNALGGM